MGKGHFPVMAVKGGVMVKSIFYDAEYRRMGGVATHDFGKAVPIPVGAMFVVQFLTTVPEDVYLGEQVGGENETSSDRNVERDNNPGRF
jgi:hypothetical protein